MLGMCVDYFLGHGGKYIEKVPVIRVDGKKSKKRVGTELFALRDFLFSFLSFTIAFGLAFSSIFS